MELRAPTITSAPSPRVAGLGEQGLGWTSTFGSGKAGDTITSGMEGAWTPNPIQWDNGYYDVIFKYEWELTGRIILSASVPDRPNLNRLDGFLNRTSRQPLPPTSSETNDDISN
jgi:hypothetical protein